MFGKGGRFGRVEIKRSCDSRQFIGLSLSLSRSKNNPFRGLGNAMEGGSVIKPNIKENMLSQFLKRDYSDVLLVM